MAIETRVIFDDDFPEALQEETLEALAPHLGILDREIEELTVKASEDNTMFSMEVWWRYHKASISISTEFFGYDETEKAKVVIHEFLHALFDPLTRLAARLILDFVEDERTRKHLLETLEETEERTVDGLAHIIGDRPRGRRRAPRG